MSGLLGELANAKQGIKDNIDEGTFEFYIAGYTKSIGHENMQVNYKHAIHTIVRSRSLAVPVVDFNNDVVSYPLGRNGDVFKILLESEPTNQYDKNATLVKGQFMPAILDDPRRNSMSFLKVTPITLGYVPKHISRIVSHNYKIIQAGYLKKIKRVELSGGRTALSLKVIFPYATDADRDEDDVFSRALSVIE